MLNKKVLLGSLVAGAMLLPLAASAGIVTGPCVNCHTMHSSQDGTSEGTPNAQLTRGNSCEGCHALATGNNGVNGRYNDAGVAFAAPQVDDATNPNLAGWFTRGGADANQHNPYNSIALITADATLTGPPGTLGGAMNTCQGCHSAADGGHHGTGGTGNYRMLASGTFAGQDDNYGGADTTAATNGGYANMPSTAATTYSSDVMNDVCASCHGVFHGSGQTSGGEWIRHPTDLVLSDPSVATQYDYLANWQNSNASDLVPLGTSASAWGTTTGANTLMCITCHFSHGGANADLLRFDFAIQTAGGTTQSPGCESCHSYGLSTAGTGM